MKKILLPCDFSAPSREAFRFAAALAKKADGEVRILNVTPLPVYQAGPVPEYGFDTALLAELEDDAKEKLDKLIAETGAPEERINLLSETGPVVPTICDVAKKHGIDVVVMGTHHDGNWLQSLIGSNTERVMHASEIPVIAIRKFISPDSIRRIVFPTNLRLDQPVAMNRLKSLQSFFGATLQVLFVNTPKDFCTDKDISVLFARFAETYKLDNYTFHVYNDVAQENGILNFAKDVNADMIAMLTHRHIGLGQLLSGSLTDEVLENATWPLWCTLME